MLFIWHCVWKSLEYFLWKNKNSFCCQLFLLSRASIFLKKNLWKLSRPRLCKWVRSAQFPLKNSHLHSCKMGLFLKMAHLVLSSQIITFRIPWILCLIHQTFPNNFANFLIRHVIVLKIFSMKHQVFWRNYGWLFEEMPKLSNPF